MNFMDVVVMLHFFKLKMSPLYAMVMLPIVLPGFSRVYFGISVAVTLTVILGSIYVMPNKTSMLGK